MKHSLKRLWRWAFNPAQGIIDRDLARARRSFVSLHCDIKTLVREYLRRAKHKEENH